MNDGKRHLWRSGWACAKCGITFVEYKEAKKKAKQAESKLDSAQG